MKCKGVIDAGSVRIGKITPNPFDSDGSDMTTWYHHDCIFNALSRAKASTKKIESTADLEGFDDLGEDDQQLVEALIEDFAGGWLGGCCDSMPICRRCEFRQERGKEESSRGQEGTSKEKSQNECPEGTTTRLG